MKNETGFADHSLSKRSLHRRLIDELLLDQPSAREGGFANALRTLPDASYTRWMMRNDPEWWRGVCFIPDAYLVDAEAKCLVIYEVVATHDIPADKIACINDLAWAIDQDFWQLILVRCDRYGRSLYDVQAASLASWLDGEKASDFSIPDWHRYSIAVATAPAGGA